MNKKAEDLIEEILENAKYDRDLAKDMLDKYMTHISTKDQNFHQFDNSKNFSKLFEVLAKSNEQLLKALEVVLKNEKKEILEDEDDGEVNVSKLLDKLQEYDDQGGEDD